MKRITIYIIASIFSLGFSLGFSPGAIAGDENIPALCTVINVEQITPLIWEILEDLGKGENPEEEDKDYLEIVRDKLRKMGIEIDVEVDRTNDNYIVNITQFNPKDRRLPFRSFSLDSDQLMGIKKGLFKPKKGLEKTALQIDGETVEIPFTSISEPSKKKKEKRVPLLTVSETAVRTTLVIPKDGIQTFPVSYQGRPGLATRLNIESIERRNENVTIRKVGDETLALPFIDALPPEGAVDIGGLNATVTPKDKGTPLQLTIVHVGDSEGRTQHFGSHTNIGSAGQIDLRTDRNNTRSLPTFVFDEMSPVADNEKGFSESSLEDRLRQMSSLMQEKEAEIDRDPLVELMEEAIRRKLQGSLNDNVHKALGGAFSQAAKAFIGPTTKCLMVGDSILGLNTTLSTDLSGSTLQINTDVDAYIGPFCPTDADIELPEEISAFLKEKFQEENQECEGEDCDLEEKRKKRKEKIDRQLASMQRVSEVSLSELIAEEQSRNDGNESLIAESFIRINAINEMFIRLQDDIGGKEGKMDFIRQPFLEVNKDGVLTLSARISYEVAGQRVEFGIKGSGFVTVNNGLATFYISENQNNGGPAVEILDFKVPESGERSPASANEARTAHWLKVLQDYPDEKKKRLVGEALSLFTNRVNRVSRENPRPAYGLDLPLPEKYHRLGPASTTSGTINTSVSEIAEGIEKTRSMLTGFDSTKDELSDYEFGEGRVRDGWIIVPIQRRGEKGKSLLTGF